jgi:hypothetical protein
MRKIAINLETQKRNASRSLPVKESIRGVISDMVQCAVKPLQDKIVELEAKVEKLQEKTNDNEQYSRRYIIRIYGLSPAPGLVQEGVDGVVPKENCAQTVIQCLF